MKRTYVQGLMVLFISVTLPAVALADKVIGSLAVVKGKVEIKDAKGKIANARVGSKVKEKDTILTGADSRAKLVMVDENVLNISPDSQINLESYKFEPDKNEKNVSINVLYGKVRSTVNQKYEGENKFHVKTPAAVAGVRGTDFLAGFNSLKKESQFVTFEGKVEVGQAGPGGSIVNAVMVNPGQATIATVGAIPAPPQAMPKTTLADMNKESTADGSGNSDRRQPANAPGAPKKEGANSGRSPSSAGGGGAKTSMIDKNDLPANPDGAPGVGPGGPLVPPVFKDPNGPGPIPRCDFCNDSISNGRSRVIINVKGP